ncbi:ABC transporter permease, partial [Achromobacter insolitus]|nr:ABC transporter permease [Achromobacter insolitus]
MSSVIASSFPVRSRGERAARLGRGFGLAVLALLVLAGLLGPYLVPHDPYTQDLLARLQEPVWGEDGSWNHILGTDQLGRDVLARALYGVRVSALIGLSVALMGGLIGTTLGVAAGYF